MKACLTGGIACGKSLLSRYLNELGVDTIDADDIVHSILPAEERARLAKRAFADEALRKRLEARLHPLVKVRLAAEGEGRLAVIPLLFEAGWDKEYDTVICVVSTRENQLARMQERRGLTRAEAEARLAAQMPAEEKAARSHYVIRNDSSAEDLKNEAARLAAWLKQKKKENENG